MLVSSGTWQRSGTEVTSKFRFFRYNADAAKAEVLQTQLREPGYSCFAAAGLDQIHRVGNSGSRPAISIHVYGVERERIATHVNRLVDVAP